MTIKTIFLDRDGVINIEKDYLHRIEDFEFIDGVFDACQYFQNLKYKIIIVTNQSGISRKLYTESDYQTITLWMRDEFKKNDINILDVFHCPHSPKDNCNCRKPKAGMFFSAIKKYNIEIERSWMIGDSERDIKAANSAGITNTILVRSGHKIDDSKSNAKFILESIFQSKQVILD